MPSAEPSGGFTRLAPTLGVLACFATGAGLLAVAVQRNGLSSAYLLGLGVEAAITLTIGLLVLGERLTVQQAAGMLLITGGVALTRL